MHQQFLQQAIDLAMENVSNKYGGPYGAIIVKGDEIIASSSNRVTANLDPTAHAEILAIRQACTSLADYKLTDCTLYSSCEPCPMCLGAIYWARLKKVFYACNRLDAANSGFDDSFIYNEIPLKPNERKIPMLQIKLANAQHPFLSWNTQSDKQKY